MSLKLVKKVEFSSDIFVFAIFGIYSLTLAPYLNRYLAFGERNIFVGIIGILIYILEIFSFKFKLFAIRLRAEEKRNELRATTGENRLLPREGLIVWVGVFARIVFRMGILYLSIKAIGLSKDGRDQFVSNFATLVFMVGIIFEFFLSAVMVIKSGLFNPELKNIREKQEEIGSYKVWEDKMLAAKDDASLFFKEVLSDIVLSIYAFMLYNGIWDRINAIAMTMIDRYAAIHNDAFDTGLNVFSWLFFVILFALPTLRLTNWIEQKVLSFDHKGQWNMRIAFLVAAVITIAPTISHFYRIYFQ